MTPPLTNEPRTGRPNFCVVFAGNIPCDVEAADEAAAVTLARSLCTFRSDGATFNRPVVGILKLDEHGNVIRKPKP